MKTTESFEKIRKSGRVLVGPIAVAHLAFFLGGFLAAPSLDFRATRALEKQPVKLDGSPARNMSGMAAAGSREILESGCYTGLSWYFRQIVHAGSASSTALYTPLFGNDGARAVHNLLEKKRATGETFTCK